MKKPLTSSMNVALGAAFTLSLAGISGAQANTNPFEVAEVGTLRIADAMEAKCGAEATPATMKSPGEATCGSEKGSAEKSAAEATCGAEKKVQEKQKTIREASCGEAKCGAGN